MIKRRISCKMQQNHLNDVFLKGLVEQNSVIWGFSQSQEETECEQIKIGSMLIYYTYIIIYNSTFAEFQGFFKFVAFCSRTAQEISRNKMSKLANQPTVLE